MRQSFREHTLALARQQLCDDRSLTELAGRVGLSYHTVRRWLKGSTKDIAVDDLQRIYETLTGKQLEY